MLAASLQAVRVNPADQELDGFVGVLAWTELVGADAIASALLLFFPGWSVRCGFGCSRRLTTTR